MTSYDRHSTPDSPHRSGRHVPLNRAGGLSSVATASESRVDINAPYHDDAGRHSNSGFDTGYGGAGAMPNGPMSPGRPYSPGMRSLDARKTNANTDGFETQSPSGEIPMQSFQDGLPPAPSVSSSWHKIETWAEEHYPELWDQICEGCTLNDLNELEHQLDCSLPQDVRESLMIHDGQERGGNPTGIIFGSMLLDCEEIVQEWDNWRKVNQEYLLETSVARPSVPSKALGGSSQASSSRATPGSPAPSNSSRNTTWRQDLQERQASVPPGAVQKAYAHPAWIPLARDWGGNNLAIDLAPGPKGTWGQVILFGRDYDTKYVVARSWAAFLAVVTDDLGSGRWFVDEETGELKLREFKEKRVEPAYFQILRWRMDQKYGRAANRRRSRAPGTASPTAPGSPYASPTEPNGEPRGRSLQRLSSNSPLPSPIRPAYGKSPLGPLSRVTEEAASGSLSLTIPNSTKPREKLVELDTPRPSGEESNKENLNAQRLVALTNGEASISETLPESPATGLANGKTVLSSNKQPSVVVEDTMKTIEI
ncbi:hypothetical protein B0H63DRAFT_495707 [Podospora didyma]|uniref:Knr4/Smi1-like domain-containing protein n=1 Tax=Podospora didyma TaxID=330526 RepID=A0AAE0KKM7_9PEZI|nr:hypothetical protein B0H63DRAFT_495707 [Podospora didyma]